MSLPDYYIPPLDYIVFWNQAIHWVPFGDKSYTNGASPENKVVLKKGETFTLTYGLYVHHGDATEGKVAEVYEQFAK